MRSEDLATKEHVGIVRIEELYPFPLKRITEVIRSYQTKDIVWLQEEPKNNGAYGFVESRFRKLGVSLRYIGRAECASPATGSPKVHKRQQQAILDAAFAPIAKLASDVDIV